MLFQHLLLRVEESNIVLWGFLIISHQALLALLVGARLAVAFIGVLNAKSASALIAIVTLFQSKF
jgi:hypothetical protein